MQKTETLQQLRDAKAAHLKWVQRAKFLVSDVEMDKDAIPLDYTECAFGCWFYSEGQKILMMPGMDCAHIIGEKHRELHETYLKIFQIYFGEEKKSFFSKIFRVKKKVSDEQQALAKEFYEELKKISEELLSYISRLERRINALPPEAFEG
jgi:hypothetical protein